MGTNALIHKFGRFELDEGRRELRLQGREVLLQPRIFDLIVYLVRNRERVVSKDELLQNLWPGTTVSEGSLQRAVSLARTALRQGGLPGAIRTFSRQGYRFCGEVIGGPVPPSAPPQLSADLERARRAFDEVRWLEAVSAYEKADRDGRLEGADLERWARALESVGRAREAIPPLERASAAHAAAGDPQGAARAVLSLAHISFETGEMAVAKGWLSRAENLLEKQEENREHGHLAWMASRFAIFECDHEEAVRRAVMAREIGRRIGDQDSEALGLLFQGHALLSLGDVKKAVALHDEAAASALTGSVTPWFGGLIYCGVIFACRNRGDWKRAGQWTDQFTRWCESNGLADYPGTCQLHRAEVLAIRGELDAAEHEVAVACERLSSTAPWAHGDAYRVRGDLHLSRGELDEAETAYRRAHELGWDPQPGLALVQAARGDPESGVRSLEHSLDDPSWVNRERRGLLLSHLAIVATGAGQLDKVRVALEELVTNDDLCTTASLKAVKARAEGELKFAEGDARGAVAALRRSVQLWLDVGSPLRAAANRILLAHFLAADADPASADLELRSAEAVFTRYKLPAMLRRCREIRRELSHGR